MSIETLAAIQQDPLYQQVAEPFIPGETEKRVRDAEFLFYKDGSVVNVEGC